MWFHEEYSAAMDLFMGSKDEDVSYFGLLRAHQLLDSVRMPLALHQHYGIWSNVRVQLEQEF
ncbi:hypothetical protein BS47DRAFT_1403051 [Hydnum rufescens UP504]|uniref:Uncharacterized protein n=1 Tax=Hydnum rufescens UP504 TaxID=1448309 RepID=A0A9P6AAY1_9AGAM|nr:hypothetical protein BS47DRAFT_1403051 [Hydnum rufescens UP504]